MKVSNSEILPSSSALERAVLGAAIQSPDVARDVIERLSPEDFSISRNRLIFCAIVELNKQGITPDTLTLSEFLSHAGDLDRAGGMGYLVDLTAELPTLPAADSYIRILKEKTARRRLVRAAAHLDNAAHDGHPLTDTVQQTVEALTESLNVADVSSGCMSVADILARDGIDQILSPPRTQALSLPWPSLQHALSGLHPGQLILIAGQTSDGKTSLALQIAAHAARDGAVLIASLEMDPASLIRRMTAQRARLDSAALRRGALAGEEASAAIYAASAISDRPIHIQHGAMSVATIAATARMLQRSESLKLLVVDYLQLLKSERVRDSRAQEVSANSRALKLLAQELAIPIVLISQLSRAPAKMGRTAEIYDLKESGDIENDADVVLLIRPQKPMAGAIAQPAIDRDIILHIAKQREGPRGLDIVMRFHGPSQRFEEPD